MPGSHPSFQEIAAGLPDIAKEMGNGGWSSLKSSPRHTEPISSLWPTLKQGRCTRIDELHTPIGCRAEASEMRRSRQSPKRRPSITCSTLAVILCGGLDHLTTGEGSSDYTIYRRGLLGGVLGGVLRGGGCRAIWQPGVPGLCLVGASSWIQKKLGCFTS